MTKTNSNPSQLSAKALSAQQVYQLTNQVLQEQLELDMSKSDFEVNDIWDVHGLLGDEEELTQLEETVNETLFPGCPRSFCTRLAHVHLISRRYPITGVTKPNMSW